MADGLETFAKVRALHDRASTPGEKAAAASRMEALARSAGMTVAEAVSKLDTRKPKTRAEAMVDAFNEIFNSPEARAQRAKVEADRLAKCREIMSRYDTEQAVFADTPREAALGRLAPISMSHAMTLRALTGLPVGIRSTAVTSCLPPCARRSARAGRCP